LDDVAIPMLSVAYEIAMPPESRLAMTIAKQFHSTLKGICDVVLKATWHKL